MQLKAVNHYTALNLTKLDVLDGFGKIKVAVAYKDPATGEEMGLLPCRPRSIGEVRGCGT